MAEKIGVYFDKSCIGPILDVEALAEQVRKKWGTLCPVVKVSPMLASEGGKAEIKSDIEQGLIDAVCICGSSPRVDWDIFDFGQGILTERINLREQCVWAYKNPDGSLPKEGEPAPELLQAMARDYIDIGITKLQYANLPEAETVDAVKTILVLGGGWSGLTAALNCSAAGYDVVLVEKEETLGGYAAKMYKTIPLGAPYDTSQETGVERKIEAVTSNDRITVLTGSTMKKLEGMPGQYEAKVKTPDGEQIFPVGSIVLAAGWVPQDTKFLEPLGYGKLKNIVTSLQFEEMAKKGAIKRPSDEQDPSSVLFLTGFGDSLDEFAAKEAAAEEEEVEEVAEAVAEEGEEEEEKFAFKEIKTYRHLPYTSELTSLNALKHANYVREFLPDAVGYIVYEHMMVPGMNELYYKAAQDDPGIMLTKGQVVEIKKGDNDNVLVTLKDSLLGELVEIEAGMVVLPTGLVPATAKNPVLEFKYRQGPSIPDLDLFSGFADSNYICFPYETRRTGVYAAGAIRQPMTLSLAETDASGAALKAIQCLESVNRGMSVHPRSGDVGYPKFNMVRCTQCKRCTEECPFGVLDEDEKGNPLFNIGRCRRCGTCMGACPERVISFDNYTVGQMGTMIKQIQVPDDMDEGGPRILILACENDAYPALDMAAMRGKRWSPYVRIIPIRCLGSVNAIWIADAMSKGNDGCMLLGCKYGDDYQCHFIKGSELCNRRMDNIGETLGKLGIETERVHQYQVAIDEYDKIPDMIDDFVKRIFELGPNPFKGY